jgi:hypothetical protein
MAEKPSTWTRIKWAILGKPVSYEEQRAAQASQFRDSRVMAYSETRNQRFHAGGF